MDTERTWSVNPRPQVALPPAVEETFTRFLRQRFPKARGDRLEAEIESLSDAFTAERNRLPGSYLNQPPIRSAYLAFFHPQQMLRGMAALDEVARRALARGMWPERTPLRVLDVGAGLGAMTHALLSVVRTDRQLDLALLDHQRSALRDARDLTLEVAKAVGLPAPKVRIVVERAESFLKTARSRGYRYDIVLLGAVLNESKGDSRALIRQVNDVMAKGGVVIIVEPAIPEVGRAVMELRESFLAKTTTIAPCTHGAECPLLAGQRDWCFTTQAARLPADVARQAVELGHQDRMVRYVLWAYAPRRAAAEFPARQGRVITDEMQGERVICTDGRCERTRTIRSAERGDLAGY